MRLPDADWRGGRSGRNGMGPSGGSSCGGPKIDEVWYLFFSVEHDGQTSTKSACVGTQVVTSRMNRRGNRVKIKPKSRIPTQMLSFSSLNTTTTTTTTQPHTYHHHHHHHHQLSKSSRSQEYLAAVLTDGGAAFGAAAARLGFARAAVPVLGRSADASCAAGRLVAL